MLSGPDQILIPIGLARDIDPEIKNLIGQKAVVGYKVPDGSVKTLELTVAGVMTKGFMTNRNSFVGADVAKKIFQATHRTRPRAFFDHGSVDYPSDEKFRKTREKGFEPNPLDSQKRTYDAIRHFQNGRLFALVALLPARSASSTRFIAGLERTKRSPAKAPRNCRGRSSRSFRSIGLIVLGFPIGPSARSVRANYKPRPSHPLRRIVRGFAFRIQALSAR